MSAEKATEEVSSDRATEEEANAEKVKEGSIQDETFLPVIYAADKDDDWTLPATWAKANPGFGTICKADYFEQEVKRCQENPRQINTFLRLHLNIWTASEERWVTDDEYWEGPQIRSSKTSPRALGLEDMFHVRIHINIHIYIYIYV